MKNKLMSLSFALSFCVLASSLVSCNAEDDNSNVKTVYQALEKLSKTDNYLLASEGNIGIKLFENRVGYTKNAYNFNDQIYVDDELAAALTSGFVNVDNKTAFYTFNSDTEEYVIDGIYDKDHTYLSHVRSFKDLHLDDENLKKNANSKAYVFNLDRDAQGKMVSEIDYYNAVLICDMIHLGSPTNYIDDLEVTVTEDGLQIDIVIEGLVQGMQNLDGQITCNVIYDGANDVNAKIEKLANEQKATIKEIQFNEDFLELKALCEQTYQLNIPISEDETIDLYYGKDYFVIHAKETQLIHKINKDGNIELYGTNEKTSKLEYLEAETKEIQKIQQEGELGADEILDLMARQIAGWGYLKNLKEFQTGGLFSTRYGKILEDEKKNEISGIVVEDMYQLTGICDAIDQELEWNCFAPYRLLGTGIGWDKKGTEKDYSDDEVTLFIVTFEGASIPKLPKDVSFTKFGVEYPGIDKLTPNSL